MATTLYANGWLYRAEVWGSDCLECGEATAGSQLCPNDGDHETVALWTLTGTRPERHNDATCEHPCCPDADLDDEDDEDNSVGIVAGGDS